MPRLFFALWPDEAAATKLARLAGELSRHCGGKAVPAGKIHLTLAFLGSVADERVADLLAVRIDSPAFAMRLDCTGAFRKVGVAWAGVGSPPRELVTLQSALMKELAGLDFALEERAYVPHMTLARKVRGAPALAPIEPIEWRAREVALVRSDTGTGRYTRLNGWHLRD
jgi:RNA 2',3'-cyclic 3'-phosphodiesterase